VELRPLQPEDTPAMAELEALCFPQDPWPEALLASALLGGGVLALGLWRAHELLAVALGRVVADEAELHSIAVRPPCRRGGLGARMLQAFIVAAREQGARQVWLEVRQSNHAAIQLYLRHAFHPMGRRPRYYDDGEDALILRLDLQESSS